MEYYTVRKKNKDILFGPMWGSIQDSLLSKKQNTSMYQMGYDSHFGRIKFS